MTGTLRKAGTHFELGKHRDRWMAGLRQAPADLTRRCPNERNTRLLRPQALANGAQTDEPLVSPHASAVAGEPQAGAARQG